MNTSDRPADRLEVHNASVNEEVAMAGGCAQVHLPSGRTCHLPHGHEDSCAFIPPTIRHDGETAAAR